MMDDRFTAPLPALRSDIVALAETENNVDYVQLIDRNGIAPRKVRLPRGVFSIATMFDGVSSARDIHDMLSMEFKVSVPEEQIHDLAVFLGENFFLENGDFAELQRRADEEYSRLPQRLPAHAGSSYPDTEPELRTFFDALFAADDTTVNSEGLVGIIVPHIDLSIGPEVYVPAMKHLLAADFDIAVILGTSHYSIEDQFIMTEKDFVTPFGVLPTHKDFVRTLREQTGRIFTTLDVAHRPEHSIEFPVLFLQYLFGNDAKTIVPILTTSFEELFIHERVPEWYERYRAFLDGFKSTAALLGKKIMFILSIDWSHIGKKFGDVFPAGDVLHVIEQSDRLQIEALEQADYRRFHSLLAQTQNSSRIDGHACITTFFDLVAPARGALLAYKQWHEVERESGVTFASMAFYDASAGQL